MLKLIGITKDYVSKSQPVVHALRGIDLTFRRNEFVAILGQSGCGKTTLLNIIGGLDRYTTGDLVIEGVSTKDYKDKNWNTYRNHSIGFVFQSYNLITHINILSNVELALTISGISKAERRKRAKDALATVGLKGMEKKMPNQLSGGQMQRVAIARALVNNPEILLADEPTGALDSETSVQIMDLLKEVAKDRLVIMVTHNPDLANEYANRIVRMSDGLITSDSNPYEGETVEEREIALQNKINKGRKKETSMSIWTAISLSFRNLMTKKGRTFLTAFAGSIGIIGIALVLSLSYAFDSYIGQVQSDALTSYPMSVSKKSFDVTSLITGVMGNVSNSNKDKKYPSSTEIKEDAVMANLVSSYVASNSTNNTREFKTFIEREDVKKKYSKYITGIEYSYEYEIQVFKNDETYRRIYPIDFTYGDYSGDRAWEYEYIKITANSFKSIMNSMSIYSEMIPDYNARNNGNYNEIIDSQYDCIAGKMPSNYDEVVIITDEYNTIDDYMLFALGLKSPQHLMETLMKIAIENNIGDIEDEAQRNALINQLKDFEPVPDEKFLMTAEQMIEGLTFRVPLQYLLYKNYGTDAEPYFKLKSGEDLTDAIANEKTVTLKVVGVCRPKRGVTTTSISGAVGYLPSLTDYLLRENTLDYPEDDGLVHEYPAGYDSVSNNAVKAQLDMPDWDVLRGKSFEDSKRDKKANNDDLAIIDFAEPTNIFIYPVSFEAKDKVQEMVKIFNNEQEEKIKETYPAFETLTEPEQQLIIKSRQVKVTDTVGTLMSSVRTIVDSVSYVLVALVSISLVVSSVMIGIITYVSVLERTKEIGILRSIGARKIDVSNVFIAETFVIGITAGIFGVGVALLIDIPIAIVINGLAGIALNVVVPWYGIIGLPVISFVLTIISGLIPSFIASKRDPVIALRTE